MPAAPHSTLAFLAFSALALGWLRLRAQQSSRARRTQRRATVCLLVDNGSIKAESTISLRRLATSVAAAVDSDVSMLPVSARYAERVPLRELGGVAAESLEPALRRLLECGFREYLILPVFFGPSDTLAQYVPKTFARVEGAGDPVRTRFHVCRPLVDLPADALDTRVAAAAVDRIFDAVAGAGWGADDVPVAVAVCDHGSPLPAVAAVRGHLAAQIEQLLRQRCTGIGGLTVSSVTACSMERRPGPEYDFNEPTLEGLLRAPGPFSGGRVVVSMLFLSPGKHAGPGGDVETIIRGAVEDATRLKLVGKGAREATTAVAEGETGTREPPADGGPLQVRMAALLADHPAVTAVLAERFHEGLRRLGEQP